MSAVLILLVLVSGYLFTNLHRPARYKQKRISGWDSYFHVVEWGTCWGVVSAFACLVSDYFDLLACFLEWLGFDLKVVSQLSIPLENAKLFAWALVSLLFAVLAGMASCFYYRRYDRRWNHIAKIAQNDHLDAIILESSAAQKPVLVTLDSRKCYVGICFGEAGLEDGGSAHVSILPLLSGYRDKDSLSLTIQINYHVHYEDRGLYSGEHSTLELKDFRVVIPKAEVSAMSFFDVETFKEFKRVEQGCRVFGADSIANPSSEYDEDSVKSSYRSFHESKSE